ncbi:MAG: paraquat-inducible protein A [Verrucomicrobiota bacterium]
MPEETWKTAAELGLVSCHSCDRLNRASASRCVRCNSRLHVRKHDSVQRTLALVVTAMVLYIPANALPIMYTSTLGNAKPSTILSGVISLWEHGSLFIAAIIFIASVFVPLAKMLMLIYICWAIATRQQSGKLDKSNLYIVTETIGRWSMIDVFVVAVLAILIQLSGLITVEPGPAVVAFAGVVVMTMFAAMALDPRLIWDETPIQTH